MRKIALAALAGAAGLVVAATPSFAYTTYQVNTDGANASKFTDQSVSSDNSSNGFNFSVKSSDGSTDPYNPPRTNFDNTNAQQTPSRDMNWQGTGYYLRPTN